MSITSGATDRGNSTSAAALPRAEPQFNDDGTGALSINRAFQQAGIDEVGADSGPNLNVLKSRSGPIHQAVEEFKAVARFLHDGGTLTHDGAKQLFTLIGNYNKALRLIDARPDPEVGALIDKLEHATKQGPSAHQSLARLALLKVRLDREVTATLPLGATQVQYDLRHAEQGIKTGEKLLKHGGAALEAGDRDFLKGIVDGLKADVAALKKAYPTFDSSNAPSTRRNETPFEQEGRERFHIIED